MEFLRYLAHLEREQNETQVEHWYSALLASMLACIPYRVWGQDVPDELQKPSSFLLKFGTSEEIKAKEEEMSEQESEEYAKLQKSIWLGMFRMDENGNPMEGAPKFKSRMPRDVIEKQHQTVTHEATPKAPQAKYPAAKKRKKVYTSGH